MDLHGLTWTDTFIHAQEGMNKIPDQGAATRLPWMFIGSNYGRKTVCVGPCGSMAKKSAGLKFD